MGLINWLIYMFIRMRLWLGNIGKEKRSRLNVFNYNVKNIAPETNGMLASIDEWKLSTPNPCRNENITLVGSSTMRNGVILQMKWRPNKSMNLATLLTQFTIELGPSNNDEIYDYEEIWTQSYDYQEREILRKYVGQNIQLEVLIPYRSYRLFFSGYMRNRFTKQLVYIRFRSLISNAGKIFDFQESFDPQFMAHQLAEKNPPCGYDMALRELVLQDRHEHAAQFRCHYTIFLNNNIDSSSSSIEGFKEEKMFCWGFHARHFIGIVPKQLDFNRTLRSKRILAYFSNGASFHVGTIESTDSERFVNLGASNSKQRQWQYGYCCPIYQITHPIQALDAINWDHISAETCQLPTIKLRADNIDMRVESLDSEDLVSSTTSSECKSSFIDIVTEGYKGRAIILINDCMESSDTTRLVSNSVQEYTNKIGCDKSDGFSQQVDLSRLDMESKEKQFDKIQPMVINLCQKEFSLYSSLCGAKAASLGQLTNYYQNSPKVQNSALSFKVPRGVVVTRYAYDSILDLNPDLLSEETRLSSIVCQGDQERIKYESERFQKFFMPKKLDEQDHFDGHQIISKNLKIPQKFLDELERMILETFDLSSLDQNEKAISFAVRSSSWGEDETNMSAAGQLTTLLNVSADRDQLLDAILVCFGSKYSLTNLEYKRQHGQPINMPMAIVIQEMIDCDKAGVMFTCDPTNGDERQVLITANYGLGESVVSAATDPDTIRVGVTLDQFDPNDLGKRHVKTIEEIVIGQKRVIITSSSSKDDYPNTTNNVELNRSDKCCLEEPEILDLAQCGLKIAQYFRQQRDIEWGLKDGHLYLFQSRPITGLDSMNDFELLHESSRGLSAEKEWLTRANIGEVLPFAITPLTYSYILQSWTVFGQHLFKSMKFLTPEKTYPQQTPEFTIFNCFYFVILRVSGMFRFGSGENRPLEARALEMGFFGHEVNEPGLAKEAKRVEPQMPPITGIIYFILTALPYKLLPIMMAQRAKKQISNLRRDILKHKFVKTSSMADLYKQMHIVIMKGCESWLAHIMLIIISPVYNQTLTNILSKYIKEPAKIFSTYSTLLSACKEVFSAGVPRQIEQMAKTIGGSRTDDSKEKLEKFLSLNEMETLRFITSEPNSNLTKMFNKFMDQFGHRSYNEFELSSKPWRDDPGFVINMIKKACQDQLNKLRLSDMKTLDSTNQQTVPKKGSVILREQGIELNLWDRLYVDYYILPKCHQCMKARELTKDLLIFNTDCVRDAVRMLAKELRQNCRIPDDDLLNYLTYAEVGRLVEQYQPGLVDQAQRRRRFYKKLANWTFDEIVIGHEFLPRHLVVDSIEAQQEKERLKLLKKITGTPACAGKIRGPVCIVNNYDQLSEVKPGDILVTYSTDIAFSPIFPIICGIITEIGGLISHGAVIAREYGLPSLIGVQNATTIFKQGEMIELDATNGFVLRLEQ